MIHSSKKPQKSSPTPSPSLLGPKATLKVLRIPQDWASSQSLLNFNFFCCTGGKIKPQVVKILIQHQDVAQWGADPHPRLFWRHQADIQILSAEGKGSPILQKAMWELHMAPGRQPHNVSTWWVTFRTSDTNVTPPASITDILWAVTSMCASGTHSSLPALPQPSVTVKLPLEKFACIS